MDEQVIGEFETKDMYLAASILNEGIKFLRKESDAEDSRKKIFVFENDSQIERIKAERANGTFVVSAVQYENSLRSIKSIIYG